MGLKEDMGCVQVEKLSPETDNVNVLESHRYSQKFAVQDYDFSKFQNKHVLSEAHLSLFFFHLSLFLL